MATPLVAVCFDAYGTLCRIGDRRDPYRALFHYLGVDPRPAARVAMTRDLGLADLAEEFAPGHGIDLDDVARDLDAEVASITRFDDASPTLDRLCESGLRLWVASNLAAPYAPPLRTLLAGLVHGFCFSFEVGHVKPEPAFFHRLCAEIGCDPAEAVMIGDSRRSDVDGARAVGMRAVHLDRAAEGARGDRISSLAALPRLLGLRD